MGFSHIKTAWEIERHDGWGSEQNTRFANLVVPYDGNEWLHQMAKAFHSGFSYGQRYIEEERKKDAQRLRDYVNDQESERIREKDRADRLQKILYATIENRDMWENIANEKKEYALLLEDMLISCLPYITDSYDDETISEAGKNHARSLEKRIREHLTTTST